jgi:hypothetical protein
MESAIVEAVTTDRPQVLLSAGDALDAFDACLERVLQQQLRLDAEGVVRSWLHTQLMVPVRMPKSRSPIEAFYRQIVKKAGPETLADFFPDLHLKHQRRDSEDSVVRALVLLSEAVQKGYSELRQELFAYLLAERSQDALAEVGLSENLEHLDDKLFVLGTILQCMIGVKAKIGTGGAVGPACRVYLMLSELEHLLTLPEEIAWAFLRAVEDLSRDVGPGLTIWMQSTARDPTIMKQIEKRLGSRLLGDWITHRWIE